MGCIFPNSCKKESPHALRSNNKGRDLSRPSYILHYKSFTVLDDYFDGAFAAVVGVGTDGAVAFNDAVLNVRIIADVNIVKNNRVLDDTVVADVGFFEDYRILYDTVNDGTAGDKAVANLRAHIVFGGRKVVDLGVNVGILLKEVVPDLGL